MIKHEKKKAKKKTKQTEEQQENRKPRVPITISMNSPYQSCWKDMFTENIHSQKKSRTVKNHAMDPS